jgi:rRNA processing protein Gar1
LNSGKIVSRVGDQLVVELAGGGVPDMGRAVFCGSQRIGSVFDIIGRVESPYVVVRTRNLSDSQLGKQVQFK